MSQIRTNAIVDASGGTTATVNGYAPTLSNMAGRNRIINGAMTIDQRNAGASVTFVSSTFPADRWEGAESLSTGALTGQQISDAPSGFANSIRVTTTAAGTAGAGENAYLRQFIEGYNTADLSWGTASATSVTLSFWVKSSLTGTFSGSLFNGGANRSYVFTYAVSAASTWEYKTVTIAGDTGGTWLTTNGRGIALVFDLGSGSNAAGSAGSWTGSLLFKATGSVSVIGTLNATWQITGVQLEAGSIATPFERRPYGTEFALCQRYYFRNQPTTTSSATFGTGYVDSSTRAILMASFPVQMRAAPTLGFSAANLFTFISRVSSPTCTSVTAYRVSPNGYSFNMLAASGLTAGEGILSSDAGTTSAYIDASAEL